MAEISITDSESFNHYLETSGTTDTNQILVNVLSSFDHHTSYNTVLDIVNKVTCITDKNRSVLKDWDTTIESKEERTEDEILDDAITDIAIDELSKFIRELEKSAIKNVRYVNRLKALIIKLINISLYTDYDNLYKPKEYEPIIDEYVEYPNNFSEFYKNVVTKLSEYNPDSDLVRKLNETGNSLLMKRTSIIPELDSVSSEEHKIFIEARKELREIIKPKVSELLNRLEMPNSTYTSNIRKVLTEILTTVDPKISSRIKEIALS